MQITKTDFQTIVYGISNLDEILQDLGASKVLLVVDSSFEYLNIRECVEAMCVPYVVFDQFTPNPLYEDVCKGVALFNEQHCDAIVAVGGGSSIDVAKCIKLYCKMDAEHLYLEQQTFDSKIPLVAIPTTAGTGSESTRFAVIYYDGKKQSVNHLSIIPNVALLAPEVLTTLPEYQKKCTVMDAFCQGIESWWSVNSTEASHALSRKAVTMLSERILPYVQGRGGVELAAEVMEAANYAGQAINITQTTAPHAFSYKITSIYHMPHGHAVAVCLPRIWEYMLTNISKCIDARGGKYLEEIFSQIALAMGCADAREALAKFNGMMQEMGLTLPEATNRDAELEVLSTSVNPVRLKNNPVALDDEAIRMIYGQIVR